jgi:hypothetical protein
MEGRILSDLNNFYRILSYVRRIPIGRIPTQISSEFDGARSKSDQIRSGFHHVPSDSDEIRRGIRSKTTGSTGRIESPEICTKYFLHI